MILRLASGDNVKVDVIQTRIDGIKFDFWKRFLELWEISFEPTKYAEIRPTFGISSSKLVWYIMNSLRSFPPSLVPPFMIMLESMYLSTNGCLMHTNEQNMYCLLHITKPRRKCISNHHPFSRVGWITQRPGAIPAEQEPQSHPVGETLPSVVG